MKIFYYFILLMMSYGYVFSQPVITTKVIPQIGDKYSFTECDTNGVKAGNSGAGITWDFSKLTKLTGPNSSYFYDIITPSGGYQSDKFKDAQYAFKSDSTFGYYKINGNKIERLGTGYLEGYELLSNYELNAVFPSTYQDNFTDNFAGVITVKSDGMDINMKRGGTITSVADAYGTLILPGGTFNNVLRFKVIQKISDTVDIGIPGVPPIVTNTETVTYYWQNDQYKFGLLSISNVKNSQVIMGSETTVYANNVLIQNAEPEQELKLSQPQITSPKNSDELETPFKVKWTQSTLQDLPGVIVGVIDEITYTLQVSEDPSWVDVSKIKEYNAGTALEFTVSDSFTSKQLGLRIKAKSALIESSWSNSVSITIKDQSIEKPPTPLLISPANGAIDVDFNKVTFTWNSDLPVVEFELYNDVTNIRFMGANEKVYTEQFLDPSSKYTWRVRQFTAEGDSSDWSESWTFTTKQSTTVNEYDSNPIHVSLSPNPGNGIFKLSFDLTKSDNLTMNLIDIIGNIIATKDLGFMNIGTNLLNLDFTRISAGTYLLNIIGNNHKFVQKIRIK